MAVTISDIFVYLEDRRRPLKEGEAVFKAGHVVLCGYVETKIMGFCLKSSKIHSDPHKITLDVNQEHVKDWNCFCTCKAGAGGYCKHTIAVLLYANR